MENKLKKNYEINLFFFCCAVYLTIVFFLFPAKIYSQCSTPGTGVANNVTPTTATAIFGCCQQGTYYLEYGLTGFTPGTMATAGTGGTLLNIPASPGNYTITGLTPATTYDYYVRIHCTAGSWTGNSTKESFSTAPDCNTVPVINCNTMTTLNVSAGPGAWSFSSPSCFNLSLGKEAIYRFTPSVSGNHVLFIRPAINGNQNPFSYYYKAASAGCNGTGWTCIGFGWPNSNQQISFGPLTAGTTYLILADVYNDFNPSTADQFRIECPYCAQPANVTETKKTPISIDLSWTGNANVLEYGPPGFIPGTGSTAGNGTMVFISGTSYTLSGLAPQTSYDIYLRAFCAGSNYSPNSLKFGTYTASCPNSFVYPSLGTSVGVYSSASGYWDGYIGCPGGTTMGEETIFKFTAPSSGYFDVDIFHSNFTWYNFLHRPASAVCDLANYNCPFPTYMDANHDYFSIGPLTSGATYDLLFDVSDTALIGSPAIDVVISCPKPSTTVLSNIRPNSITFTWNCNCPSSTYLEYGPVGFTPGTGAVAGTNGTLKTNVSSPYNLTGLTANTKYDVYLRSSCGGNFSPNTSVLQVHTAVDCAAAPSVSCSDYLSYCVTGFITTDNGAWQSAACSNANHLSAESVWRFTPLQTGAYSILVYSFSANSIYYTYPATFYIKAASLGCNEQNWTCAGNVAGSVYYGFTPVSLSLGTLTSGTTYYIMADGMQPTFTGGYCYYFRLDCPNVCSWPKLLTVNVTPAGGKIYAVCDSCFGSNVILEYGQAGFTPGTGAAAGTGGTVISNIYFPFNLSGLTTGISYDVYSRKNCGVPSGFSINSNKLTFIPCSSPPASITSSTGNNFVCTGQSITLTQSGGLLAAGGSFKWYSGSCGTTLVGTGNSISVSPAATTTYSVRAEASCGNSSCTYLTIYVYANPAATVTPAGSTTFCSGSSVTLNANTGTGLTYIWKKDGNNISGATAASYSATGPGVYKVRVANSNGCTAISAGVTVTVNALPSALITANGSATFCSGGNVILNVPLAANRTYQWKKNNNNIPGATSSSYTATTGGNYKVTVTNTVTGCSKTTTAATVVTVNSLPAATISPQGPTTFCAGGSVVLQANTGAGLTYKWKKGSSFIPGATLSNYTATTAGTYRAEVTNSNGCSKLSAGITVTVPCKEEKTVSLRDDFDFTVYPNPSGGVFTIKFSNNPDAPVQIEMTDRIGKVVKKIETKEEIVVLTEPNLAKGIYCLTARIKDKVVLKKINIIM